MKYFILDVLEELAKLLFTIAVGGPVLLVFVLPFCVSRPDPFLANLFYWTLAYLLCLGLVFLVVFDSERKPKTPPLPPPRRLLKERGSLLRARVRVVTRRLGQGERINYGARN